MRSYQHTLDGVKQGLAKLRELKIPFERPADYFAEMLKPDYHMNKVT